MASSARHTGLSPTCRSLCRDVLNVLGMYPGDPGAPGGDCAGVVARVAEGCASGLQPGDAVFGLAAGSLGSYVLASSQTMVPMPASLRSVCLREPLLRVQQATQHVCCSSIVHL